MILPQGGASYLGILLSLGWSRLFEAACVPAKTPWDDVCQERFCSPIPVAEVVLLHHCDSDSGKNLSEPHDIKWLTFLNLTSLTEGMFDGFNVFSLRIITKQVKVIEAGCFENLNVSRLHTIEMNLNTLPQGFFRGLTAERLYISGGTLSNPRAGFFKGVRKLGYLALRYINELTYLPKDFFQGLHMLHDLTIYSSSSGLCLSQTIFQPLKSVRTLSISKGTSGMTYCPKIFKGFTHATTLYGFFGEMSSFVIGCSNMNIRQVKLVEDFKEKNCDRNDGCDECDGGPLVGLTGGGSAVRGRILDVAVGVVGALILVAVLTSAGN